MWLEEVRIIEVRIILVAQRKYGFGNSKLFLYDMQFIRVSFRKLLKISLKTIGIEMRIFEEEIFSR